MNGLTRRAFGKRILATATIPLLNIEQEEAQTQRAITAIPDSIAGHKLANEEKILAAQFLAKHERNMASLREQNLPNALAPDFVFKTRTWKGETGAAEQ